MITTAVQQASQMVEVQGAPTTVQADGKDFRETFTANVSAPAEQKNAQGQSNAAPGGGGSSPGKQAGGVGLLVKSASPSSLLKVEDQAVDSEATKQARANASSDLKNSSELTLKEIESSAAIKGNDSRASLLPPSGDEVVESSSAVATAVVARSAHDAAPAADATALKGDDLSKSAEGTDARARKTGASGSSKGAGSAKTEAIASGIADMKIVEQAQLNASAAVPQPQIAGAAIAHEGSKPAVLTSTPQRATAAILQRQLALPQGDKIGDGVLRLVGADGTGALRSFAGVGDASSAATGAASSLQGGGPDTKDASGSKIAEAKGTGSCVEAVGTAVPQAQSAQAPHAGTPVKTLHAAQAVGSVADGNEEDSRAKIQGSEAETNLVPTSAGVPNAGPASAQGGESLPLAVATVRDTATASASLRAAPAKVDGAAVAGAKDGKTKGLVDGDGNAGASSAVPVQGSETPSVPVITSGAVAGTVTSAGDAATRVAQVTPHTAGATVHADSGGAAPSLAARIQGAAGAGAAAESASSAAQVGESHRTLLATPTTLEVGLQSGTQGWLRIRAEVGDQGAVNASLAAGTSGGRELLHSQMPALNAFLHSEQMAVTTTVVERGSLGSGALGSGGPGSTDGSGSNGSLFQGGGAQSGGAQGGGAQSGGSGQESLQQAVSLSATETLRSYDAQSGASGTSSSSSSRTNVSGESGRWLNVRV